MNELRDRALKGVLQFQVALALMLFLPAWSIRFWQAWAYWILFSICILSITIYFLKHDPALVRSRLAVGVRAEQEPRQKRIQGVASVLVCALFLIPGIERHFHPSLAPRLVIGGDVLVLASFMIMFEVFRENSYASSIVEVRAGQRVVSTGLYAVVRHPMYVGALVLFGATPLALGSLWAVAAIPPLIAVIAARLLDEERYLIKNLPGYKEYCGRVRYRLVPRVW